MKKRAELLWKCVCSCLRVGGVALLLMLSILLTATGIRAAETPSDGLNRPREVWVAIRDDGKPGAGTVTDPFDGGTVTKLNGLFDKFKKEYGDNITMHFGPGVFYGDRLWTPGNNWKIRGAGMDITVFKTQPNPDRSETVGFARHEISGFELSDVTFDFNAQNMRKANRVFTFPTDKEKYGTCYFYAKNLPEWKAEKNSWSRSNTDRRQAVTHKGVEYMCLTNTGEGCPEEPGTGTTWSVLRSNHPEDMPAWKTGNSYTVGETVAVASIGYICLAANVTSKPTDGDDKWQAVNPQQIDPLIYTVAAFVHSTASTGRMQGRNRVSRVRAVNCNGSSFFDLEDFVIGLGGNDCVVEDCIVEQFYGDYGTLIAIFNGRNLVIRGCTVKANGKCFAYGGWGLFDAVFENNYGENLNAATNIDSLNNRNVTFRNNMFLNCQKVGILVNVPTGRHTFPDQWVELDGRKFDLNERGMNGLYIYNNYVEIRDGAPYGAIQVQAAGLRNVVIRGNTLRTMSGSGRARAIGVYQSATPATVYDNLCETNMYCEIIPPAVIWHNNVDLLGQPMKDFYDQPIENRPPPEPIEVKTAIKEAQTKVIPGEAIGEVKYVPGKFGLAASLGVKIIGDEKKRNFGINYPCTNETFSPEEGTFACWVNASVYPCVALFQVGSDGFCIWWVKNADGESYRFFPFVSSPNAFPDGWCASTILPDRWSHMVFTWNRNFSRGAQKPARVYVNGEEDTRSPLFPPPFKMGDTISVGCLTGLIDEVVFMDKALTREEVKKLYFSGPFVPDEHTRLYINFDNSTTDGISAIKNQPK